MYNLKIKLQVEWIKFISRIDVYLVMRRLLKKLGDPWRLGIEGDRVLLRECSDSELLDDEREDRLLFDALLDDRDELEKLLWPEL